MPLRIVRNDITLMNTDAIVNTANEFSVVGAGCDLAVYNAAGYDELLSYRRNHIGEVPEGEVFLTPGFGLHAKFIIHAVSPLFIDGEHGEEELLRSCYAKSLELAEKYDISSIAIPLIATGSFGYPKARGMRIAIDEINRFLLSSDMDVTLVLFDSESTELGDKLASSLEEYIDNNYVNEKNIEEYGSPEPFSATIMQAPSAAIEFSDVAMHVPELTFPFSDDAPCEQSESTNKTRKKREKTQMPQMASFASQPSIFNHMPKLPWESKQPKEQSDSSAGDARKILSSDAAGDSTTCNAAGDFSPCNAASDFSPCNAAGDFSPCNAAGDFSLRDEAIDFSLDDEEAVKNLERKLNERLAHCADTYSEYLMYLIESKGLVNADVYNGAAIDKKVFSKIKNNKDYHPQKITALCLCVGAKLSMDDSRDLLARAGYAFSPSDLTDIIFSFYIENKHFDIYDIDIQLEAHGLPCIIK